MLVEKIMTRNVVTIDCNETVLDACKKYKEMKVGCLVVMDGPILVGIVTERDIIERAILMEKDPKTTKIRDIMSSNLKTVHALAPIERAAEIMRENNIKKLPVILNNKIVGIVTVTDMSRALPTFSEKIDELVDFYIKSKKNVDNIMEEWAEIITSLRNYQQLMKTKKTELATQ
ncbi:MAG: CBS domain-containing protein [Candidatus Thermoplasmatota archaeon]|nr:CBS domain-containing protein [Candidatus Thermoplasmatota archaeon]